MKRERTEPIEALLARLRAATPNDRIDMRDEVAARGVEAVHAIQPWLADPELWRIAIRVIGRAADLGSRHEAVDTLRAAGVEAPPARRAEIDAELARLGAAGIKRSGPFGPIDHQAIRDRLIAAAKRGELVYYSDLAQAAGREIKGPHWAVHIGKILAPISRDEVASGRPMLSAIVVSRDTKLPGGGFFGLGQELRLVEPGEDENAFVLRQTRRVFEYWANREVETSL